MYDNKATEIFLIFFFNPCSNQLHRIVKYHIYYIVIIFSPLAHQFPHRLAVATYLVTSLKFQAINYKEFMILLGHFRNNRKFAPKLTYVYIIRSIHPIT